MTVETDLYTALKSLVGNRMSPDTFPQPPAVPTWPAIRYTIVDAVPVIDLCTDGDSVTDQIRVQLDLVAETKTAAINLREAVRTAMHSFSPPARLELRSGEYDAETKTFREILQYSIHGST